MSKLRGKRSAWWVVVAYEDDETDVIGCRSYQQARQVYTAGAVQVGRGVLSAEMADADGVVVASTDLDQLTMCEPRAAGRYVWDERVDALVPCPAGHKGGQPYVSEAPV